jgi:sortase B
LDVSNINDFESIGWLRIQGTSLDLPVLYSTTNNYEFPVNFDHFVWLPKYDGEFHNMMTIFGHNIFNLSSNPLLQSDLFTRFEELMSFVYYDFAKENKYFQFTFNDQEYIFKIFAVNFVPAEEAVYFPYSLEYSENEMEEHVQYLKKNSLYDYDVDVDGTDKIISLVTCTRFFGLRDDVNFYVTGRLLRKGEKVDDYLVDTNDNYQEIFNKLKGDGKNEKEA